MFPRSSTVISPRYPSQLQLWKHYDYESGGAVHSPQNGGNLYWTKMRISASTMNGSSNTSDAIIESFTKAMNDPTCLELDLHDIEFDLEESEAFIHMLRSTSGINSSSNSSAGNDSRDAKNIDEDDAGEEENDTSTPPPPRPPQKKLWKSIKLYGCTGQVNDIAMACMSLCDGGGGHASKNVGSGGTSNGFAFHFQCGNTMSNSTMQGITFGIKYNPTLTSLSLTSRLSMDSMNTLCRSIARNTTLLELSLAGCTTLYKYRTKHLE